MRFAGRHALGHTSEAVLTRNLHCFLGLHGYIPAGSLFPIRVHLKNRDREIYTRR